jgi:HEAT repeat protein
MWDENHSAKQDKRDKPQRRNAAVSRLALLVLAAGLSLPGTMRAQGPDSDPVAQLRRVLEANCDDLPARDRKIKQCLSELLSLSDLQRAVVLVEWHESFPDAATAAVDQANQAQLIERFSETVRRMLRQGDAATVAEMVDHLAEMADSIRASGESIDIVRRFAPELADLVKRGPPSRRAAAARTLAQIEPPLFLAVPALGELLHANETELRLAAADSFAVLIQNALQAVGSGAAVQRPAPRSELVLTASGILPAVHHGLNDARPEVRRRCLETIGLAAAALTKLLDDSAMRHSPQAEREELHPLLLALRDQGPILVRSLGDADAEARIRTHKALEELGLARQRWMAANDPAEKREEDVLGQALEQALPGLAAALGHKDVRVRRSALDALETCGPLALPVLPALTRALHDSDRFVRWSAVRTVGKLGPAAAPQTVSDLTRLLRDPDLGLRKAAAAALTRVRPAPSAGPDRASGGR